MAVSKYIKNENAVYLALGYNVNQPIPLDARLVVTTYSGLTQASSGDNIFYDGIVVSVVDDPDEAKNGLYQLIHMPSSDINNWHKLANEEWITSSLSNISVNGVTGVKEDDGINITIGGDAISLGESYDGEVVRGMDGNTDPFSPTSADTINQAIKKIIDIIIEDEEVIAASANDLNSRINNLSGDSITNVSIDDTKTKLLITKGGVNIEIPLTDLANVYTFDAVGDADHNIIFTTKEENGKIIVQANLTSLDCGEYVGEAI